jgi:hypothetical protein
MNSTGDIPLDERETHFITVQLPISHFHNNRFYCRDNFT